MNEANNQTNNNNNNNNNNKSNSDLLFFNESLPFCTFVLGCSFATHPFVTQIHPHNTTQHKPPLHSVQRIKQTMMYAPFFLFVLFLIAAFDKSSCFVPVRIGSLKSIEKHSQASFPRIHKLDGVSSTSEQEKVNAEGEEQNGSLSSPLDKPVLAAADFAAIMVFAAVGKASHAADGSIDIGAVLQVALPFLLSWFGTSPLTNIYSQTDQTNGITGSIQTTAKGWIVAIPLGCVLRGVFKGYVPPAPFVIVTMIATLIILGGTRVLYTVVEDKLNGSEG